MNTTGGRLVAFACSTCRISCSTMVVAGVWVGLEAFMGGESRVGRFKVIRNEYLWHIGENFSTCAGMLDRVLWAGREIAIFIMRKTDASQTGSSIPGHLTALMRH